MDTKPAELAGSEALVESFSKADQVVSRHYLLDVIRKDVVPVPADAMAASDPRLFRLQMLVVNPEEDVNDKLTSVFSSVADAVEHVSLALVVRSTANNDTECFLGVDAGVETGVAATLLKSGFDGNFPGSELRRLKKAEVAEQLRGIRGRGERDVACLTILPAQRSEQNPAQENTSFVQGLEKFIDSMRGKEYTAIFLAEAVKRDVAEYRKSGLEMMYSSLVPFSKTTVAFGENVSEAVGESVSRAVSKSLTKGVSRAVSDTVNHSDTVSSGTSVSYRTDGFGDGWTFGKNDGKSHTDGKSHGVTNTKNRSTTEGSTETTGSTKTATEGSSLTRTFDRRNKSVEDMLEQIGNAIDRMKSARSFGLWNTACYFVADDIQTLSLAANTLKGVITGECSGEEEAHISIWSATTGGESAQRRLGPILDSLVAFRHPRFSFSKRERLIRDCGCLVGGRDLPIIFMLPRRTIPGMAVYSIAEFGRNVFRKSLGGVASASDGAISIRLGQVCHMGKPEGTPVELDLETFRSHCFIAGSTGSGKSNTTYGLVSKFVENDIGFLVIEPAKGEYKGAFATLPGLSVFTTNPQYNRLLRINPFSFHENIHILEHLDRLIEIFNVCWEMYAAMPALLKAAIERSYIEKGWDLDNSMCLRRERVFPTFRDLLGVLPDVIARSGYKGEALSDYKGALMSRVTSLTNGIFGQIFCSGAETDDATLFDGRTIVDLSRVGSSESKSLIMGLLVLKLTEYRMATATQSNAFLRHVTIMEEAHNLLKRADGNASQLAAKSVEMITNSIAEMRTYGEGFVIVDQSPTAVDIAAIKNTNTKIIMKLPDVADCGVAGNAFGLNEYQISEIPKLTTGMAVVMQNSWVSPVLTLVDRYDNAYEAPVSRIAIGDILAVRSAIAAAVDTALAASAKPDGSAVWAEAERRLAALDVPADKKAEYAEVFRRRIEVATAFGNTISVAALYLDVLSCRNLFDFQESMLKVLDDQKVSDEKKRAAALAWYRNLWRLLAERYLVPADTDLAKRIVWKIVCAGGKASSFLGIKCKIAYGLLTSK